MLFPLGGNTATYLNSLIVLSQSYKWHSPVGNCNEIANNRSNDSKNALNRALVGSKMTSGDYLSPKMATKWSPEGPWSSETTSWGTIWASSGFQNGSLGPHDGDKRVSRGSLGAPKRRRCHLGQVWGNGLPGTFFLPFWGTIFGPFWRHLETI